MSDRAEAALERVLLVIDPTQLVQVALEKAEWIASRNDAELRLYCCIWDAGLEDDEAAARTVVNNTKAWLERIAILSREGGLSVTIEVEWHPDWRSQIAAAAARCDADLIIKTAVKHKQLTRQLLRTSDWTLLRDSSCPTLLVNPKQSGDSSIVLAAIKLTPNDQAHVILNERVIQMSQRIAVAVGADLHAVTVYKGDDMYFDRQKFADSCGLARNRVHAAEGAPHRGIAEVSEQIDAGVLVVGCAASQSPERGVIIGDTAQRVIDEVAADVVVVPAA